jgi:tRNA A64-2'-O-ribosylphosphate transferase
MNEIRNRLLSIQYDVETFVNPQLSRLSHYPVIANDRCGTWYHVSGGAATPTGGRKTCCYFKSTDGHVGSWNFSLKRLNLTVITSVSKAGGCMILDASVRKEFPDSLSRTIPIWACVMNRFVTKLRQECNQLPPPPGPFWDHSFYSPDGIVTEQEHTTIENLIDGHVEALYSSGAIVNPKKLMDTLTKPLRPCWISSTREIDTKLDDRYFSIICISCSSLSYPREHSFSYLPGAADDEESWSRKLTPELFWNHHNAILAAPNCAEAVDTIVSQECHQISDCNMEDINYHEMGNTRIYIGSRRAGCPPMCWQHFDAILAVTDLEYNAMSGTIPPGKFYLQLPIKEGKKDRTGLEEYLPVGIIFIIQNINKRILIHCAQGKDRSVAVVIAFLAIVCELKHPLQLPPAVSSLTIHTLSELVIKNDINEDSTIYLNSGMDYQLYQKLLGRDGRDLIFGWFRQELAIPPGNLATKDSLRIALQIVQQYREKASPSRATMQKLHRFFMSSGYE